MANIQRPLKTYGTRSYVAEVAAAPGNRAPILSAEVDLDLDTIYNAYNAGPNIAPGSLTTGMYAPGSVDHNALANDAVWSNNIKDGSITLADLAPNSVDSSKIVDGSIQAGDLAPGVVIGSIATGTITIDKLAPGASIFTYGRHRKSNQNVDITNTTSAGFLQVPAITARSNGIVHIRGYVYGMLSINDATDETFGIRLFRDFTNYDVLFHRGQGVNVPWSIYYEDILTVDTAAHVYTIDVYSNGNGFCVLHGGSLVVVAPA